MKNTILDSNDGTLAHLMSSRKLTRGNQLRQVRNTLTTGIPMLDHFLPTGGYVAGAINEWVGPVLKHTFVSFAVAHHSQTSPVAFLSTHGTLNPLLLESIGGNLQNCFFAVEPDTHRFAWLVEQVMASGAFPLVAVYASHWQARRPWFSAPVYRRLLALVKRHATTLVVLLEPHESLPFLARTASLRLALSGDPSRTAGQIPQGTVEIEKCSGFSPGATLTLTLTDLFADASPSRIAGGRP